MGKGKGEAELSLAQVLIFIGALPLKVQFLNTMLVTKPRQPLQSGIEPMLAPLNPNKTPSILSARQYKEKAA